MMKKLFTVFLVLTLSVFISPMSFAKNRKNLTTLEKREMQTRIFETSDKREVLKAAINTLQDSGFIIQEIEPEIGFIRAEKSFKKRLLNKKRLAGNSILLTAFTAYAVFSYGSTAYYVVDPTRRIANEMHEKTAVVSANVNVDNFGKDKMKVRMVMVEKFLVNADGFSYMKSAPMRVIHLNSPDIYQEFFAQLDKNIFYGRI